MDIVAWYVVGVITLIPLAFLFWFLLGVYRDTRPDRMRAVFIDENKQLKVYKIQLEGTGKSFRIKGVKPVLKYRVVESAVVRSGMFRIPTIYYIWGNIDPINLLDMRVESSISASEFEEATESHVAQDIIHAFASPAITPATTMLLLVVVMLAGLAFVWFDLSGSIDDISVGLGLDQIVEVSGVNNSQ